MKSFPSYRILVIIGWIAPPIISFFLLREFPIHIIIKIILFPILSVLIFFGLAILGLKISKVWNNWQRSKGESSEK